MQSPPADSACGASAVRSADVVDWGMARVVARQIAGADPFSDSYLATSLTRDFAAVTDEAAVLVYEYTGLVVDAPTAGIVVSRREWVDTNIGSMQRLMAPLADRFGSRLGPFGIVSRRVTGAQSGVLLGLLAQRVLGQYDLFFADDAQTDAVLYVGGNILTIEKRFAFRPRDFRLWIALHEVTHRAQFAGIPWLRGYFLGLVNELLSNSDPDWSQAARTLRTTLDRMRARQLPWDESGILGLIASPEQRQVIDRIQAMMTLLEGHGNAVMNALGREHVEGQARMAEVLTQRRSAGGVMGVLQRLLGLEAKMRQYDIGERFVASVTELAGPTAIARAWSGPEALPTIEELLAPVQWLERVGDAPSTPVDGR